MHGADKPVAGDLIFDTESEKAETEDAEMADESPENGDSQEKAAVEGAL